VGSAAATKTRIRIRPTGASETQSARTLTMTIAIGPDIMLRIHISNQEPRGINPVGVCMARTTPERSPTSEDGHPRTIGM